jgi:hypothetical protein
MKAIKKTLSRWEWRTHVPILSLIIDNLQPTLIVELGVGVYSSPLFLNCTNSKVILIDNDEEWLKIVKNDSKIHNDVKFIFHDLGSKINRDTLYKDLTDSQKLDIKNYYKELSSQILDINSKFKLLFVDGWACTRNVSINCLYTAFDIVVYHDAEQKDLEYSFDDDLKNNYRHFIFKTSKSWTGLFVKSAINLDIVTLSESFIKKWAVKEKIETNNDMFVEEIKK